jgi:two-component system LytT family response regulator
VSVNATLRVVIADDERPARLFLRGLLETCEDVHIVGEATNGTDAVAVIERERPDLALLDLQMPELDGLDVVRIVRTELLPLVAFVTAYDSYAVRAFELNAVDYLLKPVEVARLRHTLNRAHERLEQRASREDELAQVIAASSAIPRSGAEPALRRIPVRRRDDIVFVAIDDVASVVADGELLWITTLGGERYTINYRLKDLEARMDGERFIRLSRSALVNADAITKVSPLPGGTYVVMLANKQQLGVSRIQARTLRETLLRL